MFSVPFWDEGEALTCAAGAAVTGARFVKISAGRTNDLPTVIHAGAGQDHFGVSATDAASGDALLVHRSKDIITSVTAGATLTAGQLVMSDANGQAIVWTTGNVIAGRALDDCASGALAIIDRNARGTSA